MPFHPDWRSKAVMPVAVVLLVGLALFATATVELETVERYQVLAVAAAGALVILAVLLVALAGLIQRPLVELTRKIERVREGDLHVRVDFADRNDEIGRLGRDFNEMVRQLRESREQLEQMHQTQMSRAEHLATLGELAAGLAHEVRNPLAGIAGAVDILGRDLPASNPNRPIVADVQQEVRRIQNLLAELLDYARPRPPEIRPADLNATVEHAVQLARQQVASRPIEVRFVPCAVPLVAHDPVQMERVLLNLMLNAFQAIGEEGLVVVEIEQDEGKGVAAVIVRDSGHGISPDHLPNIFRPFYTTKRKGTGLGLSLSRRIVEQHGGRIEVRSILGKGTEFTIRLPLAMRDAKPAEESEAKWQRSKS